jgi:ubiquinone/menaquinone biosynthesis C-methylase UbiE
MMSQPKGYVDTEYLQIAATVTEQIKRRSYTLMGIQSGDRVLDVGCGPGTDTLALAQLVGGSGQVVGVDYDEEMIVEADKAAAEANVGPNVKHAQADASALPFESGTFDSCRSERLFQHLRHPGEALSEMVRVTKPGGRIVVLDTDWGSGSIDSPHVDIERRVMRVHTECCLNNGYSGRQLYRLFRQQDMGDIVVEGFCLPILSYPLARQMGQFDEAEAEALSAGVVSSEELDVWRAALEQADADGAFFASASLVLVAGRMSGSRSEDEAG